MGATCSSAAGVDEDASHHREPLERFEAVMADGGGGGDGSWRFGNPSPRYDGRRGSVTWAASRPELWALIAEHSGLVGAWRLTGVCKAAREGAKFWLRTLPGLVV
jgi:hypothetical protein